MVLDVGFMAHSNISGDSEQDHKILFRMAGNSAEIWNTLWIQA